MKYLVISFSILSLWNLSCAKKDIDVEPPKIVVIGTTPDTEAGIICGAMDGDIIRLMDKDTLYLDLLLTDNLELSQLKLDVHNNFDCHGHRSNTIDLFFQNIYDLQGAEQYLTIGVPVGDNPTSGVYHLGLIATDKSGNVTDQSLVFSLVVRNSIDTISPELSLTNPAANFIDMKRGQILELSGLLIDNRELYLGGNAGIELLYKNKSSGNYFRAYTKDLSDIVQTSYEFSIQWQVPVTLVRGTYDLLLTGYDGVRNESNRIQLELKLD
jgi:hypothetical protein